MVGTTIRVAKVSPATVLGLPPAAPPLRFDRSLENLERNGVISPTERQELEGAVVGTPINTPQVDTPEKQRIREQIELDRRRELLAKARLEIERREALARRYKTFGDCTYDWQSWGKSPSGVRSVMTYPCRGRSEIAVDCQYLKVNERVLRKWSGWKIPTGGQVDMVAEVCANLL